MGLVLTLLRAVWPMIVRFCGWLIPALAPLFAGLAGAFGANLALDEYLTPILTQAKNSVESASATPVFAYVISTTHVFQLFAAYSSAYVTALVAKVASSGAKNLVVTKK